ncbi:3-methyl-2-oxobutanoate hydroxymethyltransferase [bacterium]|nr:3-methyl-2-oxobutanoate hydroxymethyltransferase [bacterium]
MSQKITVKTLQKYRDNNEKISMLTAYDYSTAKYIDEAGVDVVLVGDSLGMVALGYDSTCKVTLDEMLIFTKAVCRGVNNALVVADMPFLSYHANISDAILNCGKMIQAGANAVKIEGGSDYIVELVKRLTQSGIPVVAHIGFTPQSVNAIGGYKIQGKTDESVKEILNQALALEKAGACVIVLEMIPESAAKYITENLKIPTISCGAGKYCSGQVLVSDDMFGKYGEFKPKFVRRYGDMKQFILNCASKYNSDVKSGSFPDESEIY